MTREEAIDVLKKNYPDSCFELLREAVDIAIKSLKQPEILTYEEQCIFLAAMRREYKLCEKIDKNPDLPSKNSLSFICKEIMRKVKATLWRREE